MRPKQVSSETKLTARGQFVGTVHCMAPEQVEGLGVDTRADVYGLACVAFHALTGSPPFDREPDVSVAMAHLNERPPALMPCGPISRRGSTRCWRPAWPSEGTTARTAAASWWRS